MKIDRQDDKTRNKTIWNMTYIPIKLNQSILVTVLWRVTVQGMEIDLSVSPPAGQTLAKGASAVLGMYLYSTG